MEALAKLYLAKANEEDRLAGPTALVFDGVGQPDDQDRHKLAAKAARDLAAEMQRRLYILTHGTEGNYRNLMLKEYGINNPDLDTIAAYYAEKFNDQPTLNWLKLQHPASRPRLDPNGLAMMALFPEGEAAEEASQGGGAGEESTFEKANKAEDANTSDKDAATLKPYSEGSGHHVPAKSAFTGDAAYDPNMALAIPNSELASENVSHSAVTGAQQSLYRAYAQRGQPLTWEAVQSIETRALVKGGMSPAKAAATVRKAIDALKDSGVSRPTRIPWGGN